MAIINLTPHDVCLYLPYGLEESRGGWHLPDGSAIRPVRTFAPSGVVARAAQRTVSVEAIDGVPCVQLTYGEPEHLPDPAEGTFLIVSALTVASARSVGRTTADLLTVAETVRNSAGAVVGCCALCRN